MRLNHPDYIRLVKQAYKEKCANNELSLLLAQSTPAKIRQACLHLYKEQYESNGCQMLRRDEQVLRDFFGPAESGKQFLQLIGKFETDRFRPLDNYLKGNNEKTDNTNLELLAWLIDFRHRPYSFDKNFQLTDEEKDFLANNGEEQTEPLTGKICLPEREEAQTTFQENETKEAPVQTEAALGGTLIAGLKNGKKKREFKRAGIIILVLLICAGAIYALWQQKKNANTVCVYWANDHYEPVPCHEETKGRIIIPMSLEKVRSFRRITQVDTITEWSVGRVYYIKDSNIIKCYTEDGMYPEDLNRNLKLLSHYIFDTHLRKKETIGKDSLVEQNKKGFN